MSIGNAIRGLVRDALQQNNFDQKAATIDLLYRSENAGQGSLPTYVHVVTNAEASINARGVEEIMSALPDSFTLDPAIYRQGGNQGDSYQQGSILASEPITFHGTQVPAGFEGFNKTVKERLRTNIEKGTEKRKIIPGKYKRVHISKSQRFQDRPFWAWNANESDAAKEVIRSGERYVAQKRGNKATMEFLKARVSMDMMSGPEGLGVKSTPLHVRKDSEARRQHWENWGSS